MKRIMSYTDFRLLCIMMVTIWLLVLIAYTNAEYHDDDDVIIEECVKNI